MGLYLGPVTLRDWRGHQQKNTDSFYLLDVNSLPVICLFNDDFPQIQTARDGLSINAAFYRSIVSHQTVQRWHVYYDALAAGL